MSMFPVQAALGGFSNGSPDFPNKSSGKYERTVAENAPVDANVGAAVRASVRSVSPTDTLTYSLRAFTADDEADTDLTVADDAEADAADFVINQETGRITVADELNFEATTDPARDGEYVVVVEAVDPSGMEASVVVVITVQDRNDNPVLTGRSELTIAENRDGHTEAGVTNDPTQVFDGNAEDTVPTVNVYDVDDEDAGAGIQRWSFEGVDGALFQRTGLEGRTLVFRDAPDFENPADANGDNIYKVTIVATDYEGGVGKFDISIEVRNEPEDGSITLFDENGEELVQPNAHETITAVLEDSDGGIGNVVWMWTRDQNLNGDFTGVNSEIGTNSDEYMARNEDAGYYLRVEATYTDTLNSDTSNPEPAGPVTSAKAVLRGADIEGDAPVFSANGNGAVTTSISVEVAENSPAGSYVGVPLMAATDEDTPDDALEYSLEGVEDADRDDTDFFELITRDHDNDANTPEVATRQLRVKADLLQDDPTDPTMYYEVDLDHEDDDANSFTVVLKASDGSKDTTLTVNITVADRNEAPSTPATAEEGATTTPDDNNAPEFPAETATRTVAVGTAAGENIQAPVEATDADDDTLTYTLGGTDATSFGIERASGQLLTTAASEALAEGSYNVRVTVSDGKATDYVDVTITVGGSGVLGDLNGDGSIDKSEVIEAYRAYIRGEHTKAEIIQIYRLYIAG